MGNIVFKQVDFDTGKLTEIKLSIFFKNIPYTGYSSSAYSFKSFKRLILDYFVIYCPIIQDL